MGNLKVGFARTVINPMIGIGISGYFSMKENYREGGYEARSSKFKEGVGELIIKEGLKALKGIE